MKKTKASRLITGNIKNVQLTIPKRIKHTAIPLLLLLGIFSCTDLQTANEDVNLQTEVQDKVWKGEFISATELLPEPDLESIISNIDINPNIAKTRLYNKVMIHPKGEASGINGAPIVDNFADAIERVETGGP